MAGRYLGVNPNISRPYVDIALQYLGESERRESLMRDICENKDDISAFVISYSVLPFVIANTCAFIKYDKDLKSFGYIDDVLCITVGELFNKGIRRSLGSLMIDPAEIDWVFASSRFVETAIGSKLELIDTECDQSVTAQHMYRFRSRILQEIEKSVRCVNDIDDYVRLFSEKAGAQLVLSMTRTPNISKGFYLGEEIGYLFAKYLLDT